MLPPVDHSIDQHGSVDWGHAFVQAGIVGLGTGAMFAVRGVRGPLVVMAGAIGAAAAFASFVVRDLVGSRRRRAH